MLLVENKYKWIDGIYHNMDWKSHEVLKNLKNI